MRRGASGKGWPGAAIAAAIAVGLSAAWPAPAGASTEQRSIFQDDDLLLYSGAQVRQRTLAELQALGVEMVRASLAWRAVAPGRRHRRKPSSLTEPSNPASYPELNWNTYDGLVRDAQRSGIDVLFNITGGAPIWATGVRRGRHVSLQYLPSPSRFGEFVTAVGRRYSGSYRDEDEGNAPLPTVRYWSIWNEPNQVAHLQPQYRRDRRTGRLVPYSPHWYRRLYRAAHSALVETGHAADVVLIGETAPLGNTRPGVKRQVPPLIFMRELFCLDGSLRPFHMTLSRRRRCDFGSVGPLLASGYAHHPYSVVYPPPTAAGRPYEAMLGDTDKLISVMDGATAAHRLAAGDGSFQRQSAWYTEYGYQTNPPDPFRGISLAKQSDWIAEAELYAWSKPRVASMAQFLLVDALPRRRYQRGSRRYWGSYQSGLRLASGQPKPGYFSYLLPFVAFPPNATFGATGQFWGMVRPGRNATPQEVRLEFAPLGGGFAPSGDPFIVDDTRGYFTATRPLVQSGYWRMAWRDPSSGAWLGSPARLVSVGAGISRSRRPPPQKVGADLPSVGRGG
jgi:hypothetical protein